jgi:uncharacterized protein YkwD
MPIMRKGFSPAVAAGIAGASLLLPGVHSARAAPAAGAACSGPRAQALLCAINAARRAHGAAPLRRDRVLGRSASRHARDMVARRYFEHTSPTGVTFRQRVAATGWMRGRLRWSLGEDLAWGAGAQADPKAIVRAWLRSPPHRRILLDGRYAVVGLGIADGTPVEAGASGATFAADFGT